MGDQAKRTATARNEASNLGSGWPNGDRSGPTHGTACAVERSNHRPRLWAARFPTGGRPNVQLRRREFVALFGGATAWPLAAWAQQAGKIYRIGFLANDPTIPTQPAGQAFLNGLQESGFIEGKNVTIERRFAKAVLDRYDDLLAELIRLQMDLIVTSADNAALAAKRSNTKIPVVMLSVTDPVGQGIVASLAHPGGNITGLSQDDSAEIAAKRMQLLKDAIPHAAHVAVLLNPDLRYGELQWQQLELAAPSLNVSLRRFVARQVSDFERAFDAMRRDRSDVLFVTGSSLNFVNRRLIIELAAQSRLPIMASWKECTEAGGLMSYGYSRTDSFQRAAIYVGKIGAMPGDLPVEQPTKYELIRRVGRWSFTTSPSQTRT
jgi:putative tryptophan/tyrosine transport system substrate-binding protein